MICRHSLLSHILCLPWINVSLKYGYVGAGKTLSNFPSNALIRVHKISILMYENGFWRWILINGTDVIMDRLVYMTTDLFDKVKKPILNLKIKAKNSCNFESVWANIPSWVGSKIGTKRFPFHSLEFPNNPMVHTAFDVGMMHEPMVSIYLFSKWFIMLFCIYPLISTTQLHNIF